MCGCSSQMVGGNFWARIQKFGGAGDGWDGALVMRQLTDAIESISCLSCSRCSHLEYFRVHVAGSHCSGRVGVAYEYENWNFREMTFFVGAILGSTVDTCSASVLWLLRTYFTCFALRGSQWEKLDVLL